MPDKQQLTSSFSWNTLTVVLQVLIQLAYTGLLARLLSKDSFMLMGIVLSIMGFAEIFSQVGVGPALIQRKEVHPQHINGAFYTALILGLTFTLLFISLSGAIAAFYELPELDEIIMVVCMSFTISAFAVVPRSMMMKNMRFKTMFKASMVSIIGGNLVVGLVLAYLGWNVWAYVWALFAQNLLMTIALWYYEPVRITKNWEWKYTRELIRYGAGSTLFNALNYLATKLDVMLVPRFMRGQSLTMTVEQKTLSSYYERANYAMTQPITIMGKLSDSVLFSGMSKLQDESEKLAKMLLIATNVLAIVIVPVSVYIAFFADDLIIVWLGEEYQEAGAILKVLFFAVIFRSLSKLGDSLLRARDAVYQGAWFKGIYVVLIAISIYTLMPFGMIWVSAGIVASTMIHYFMNMFICTKLVKISFTELFAALLPSIKLGTIAFVAAFGMHQLQVELVLPKLIILLISALVVFGAVALAVFKFPNLLGSKTINMLYYLPKKVESNKWIKMMVIRLK